MWSLWSERNKVLHGRSPKNVSLVVAFAESYSTEFNSIKMSPQHLDVTKERVFSRWILPPQNTIKMNTDADHTGSVIAALSKKLEECFSVEVDKLLAVCEGLQFAAHSSVHVDCVESDALRTIQGLQSTFPLAANVGLVVLRLIQIIKWPIF
ncbi:hypothetical protein PanWU01x14_290050 [Parasponia andersonii]|uniref:Uncharacterized protein n=1 Tax=Parasponia andersonii TaxID=3476 RepID=A0A2P5AY09_PARAD|nr:hypothetical protein PanWU01x14_290050 [Parasponia andersonii]